MAVTGIGGLFFRAKDPEALTAWYRDRLGVIVNGYTPWEQAAGPTMVVPFAGDTDYWAADRQWMLNLRVDELDGMRERLRAAGVTV